MTTEVKLEPGWLKRDIDLCVSRLEPTHMTADLKALKERLRDVGCKITDEAADEIARLEAELFKSRDFWSGELSKANDKRRDLEARIAELTAPPTDAQVERACQAYADAAGGWVQIEPKGMRAALIAGKAKP